MDSNCYVLLWNVRCAGERRLASGLTLRPLNAPLSVFDLAAAGAVGFRGWACIEPIARDCVFEIESSKDSDVTPGYDTLNRAWLASALLILRGYGDMLPIAVSAYSWSLVAGFQKRTSEIRKNQIISEGPESAIANPVAELSRFTGHLLDYRLKLIGCPAAAHRDIADHDVDWIHVHYDAFNRMASSSERFRFALEAVIDWRYAHDLRSALARIWAGIESLFGINAELVYRLSITAASLLRPRGEARIEYAERIKKLYSVRSKAVHGDEVSAEKLSEALDQSFVLLRDLITHSIVLGRDIKERDIQVAIMS